MKKVLTFSTNVSAGHRRAAEAVANAILATAPDAEIVQHDAMTLIGDGRRKFLTETYLGILKYRPSLWNHLYHNKSLKKGISKFFRILLTQTAERFEAAIDQHQPDVIVCTQVIPAKVIAGLKELCRVKAPLLVVATDYGIHPYWADPFIDKYAVPCDDAAKELHNDNIPADRIHVTGIPVDSVFETPPSRSEARKELGIPQEGRYILAMGGGNGLGLEAEHIAAIEKADNVDGVLVISGCNKELEKQVREMPSVPAKERRVFSMVNEIEKYYAASDMLVSKPGGLTMSEATAMSMPIVMISPLPGQEVRNAKFLKASGVALEAQTSEELSAVLRDVLHDEARLISLRQASRRVGLPWASRKIANIALEMAKAENTEFVLS